MVENLSQRRLGRGLAALIGEVEPEGAVLDRARMQRRVSIEFLRPNPRNPRQSFSEADLEELCNSVREKGIVQPIIVRPDRSAVNRYEIIAGERRWRAAQKVGLHEVPIIVNEASDKEALEIAIVENVQRSDLNPIEEAMGYQQLMDEFGYTQQDLGSVIGKSRSHVANTLRLLKLPEAVHAFLRDGRLSAGHARTLVTADDPVALARRIVEEGLSVRDAERIGQSASAKPGGGRSVRAEKDADTRALEKTLSDQTGLVITIEHSERGSGEVRIRYKTLEQLDTVCRLLQAG